MRIQRKVRAGSAIEDRDHGSGAFLIFSVAGFCSPRPGGIFQQKAQLPYIIWDDAERHHVKARAPLRLTGIAVGSLDKVRLLNSTNPPAALWEFRHGSGERLSTKT